MDTLDTSSLPRDAAPRGHAAVKALAQQLGCPLKDVVALSKSRDPFLSRGAGAADQGGVVLGAVAAVRLYRPACICAGCITGW